jgi:hypothetical protein
MGRRVLSHGSNGHKREVLYMDNAVMGQNQPTVDAAQSSTQNYTPPQGRTFTQDEVNYLTSKVRADAYEQSKRELSQTQHQTPAQPQISMDEIIAKTKAELRQELKQEQDNAYVSNLANAYHQTIAQGVLEYGQEYKTTVESVNWGEIPALVPLVVSQPNSKEVMYELSKDENLHRFSEITNLLSNRQFAKAETAMKKFSASVASNKNASEAAKAQASAPEPLSAIKPSTAAAKVNTGIPTTWEEMSAAVDSMRARKRR